MVPQDEQDRGVLETRPVKVTYDVETDTLTVAFQETAPVRESDEVKPGFIMDLDDEGGLVSIELLDASKSA
jgi:uncharacterized protein YuzE